MIESAWSIVYPAGTVAGSDPGIPRRYRVSARARTACAGLSGGGGRPDRRGRRLCGRLSDSAWRPRGTPSRQRALPIALPRLWSRQWERRTCPPWNRLSGACDMGVFVCNWRALERGQAGGLHGPSVCAGEPKRGRGQDDDRRQPGRLPCPAGKRVLLVDVDPQANATSSLGVDKNALARSVYDVLLGGEQAGNSGTADGMPWPGPVALLSGAGRRGGGDGGVDRSRTAPKARIWRGSARATISC